MLKKARGSKVTKAILVSPPKFKITAGRLERYCFIKIKIQTIDFDGRAIDERQVDYAIDVFTKSMTHVKILISNEDKKMILKKIDEVLIQYSSNGEKKSLFKRFLSYL